MEALAQWFDHVVEWLVHIVETFGVWGIFIMTFLESTFMPIPSAGRVDAVQLDADQHLLLGHALAAKVHSLLT